MKNLNIVTSLIVILLFILPVNLCSQYYYNQYAALDGIDDYLSTGSHSELLIDSAFTIEGWLYVQDTLGTNKTILSTINSSLNSGYAVLLQGSSSSPGNAGKIQLNLNGGNNNFIQTASTRFPLNSWAHFAVTFRNASPNSDTIRFYINGSLVQTFTSNMPPPVNSTEALRCGNCYIPGNFTNGFKGRIDDLRIYLTQKTSSLIANDRGIPVNMAGITDISLLDHSNFYRKLSAAWLFDGSGNDDVGAPNNFSPLNGAFFTGNLFSPANYKNQSNFYLRFPGSSWLSYADETNSVFDLDTACTIEAWVFIDAYRTQPQTIVSKGTSAYSYILAISSNPSNSPLFILNSGAKLIQSTKPLLPRVWNHVAATYRASTGELAIIVNGVMDTNRILTPGSINVTNDSLYIGRSLFGDYTYGCIDGLKISKFAKSVNEIKSFQFTSIDNFNNPVSALLQCSYNFEGNTINNISNLNPLRVINNVYFERLNNVSGASGFSQSPVLRLSNNDPGFESSFFNIKNNRIHIINGQTVRDSIFINGVSGNNRINAVVLLNHTSINDLTLNLRAPNGTSVNFHSAQGSTNNDIMTVYDDLADSVAGTLNAPFSFIVKPVNPLSSLPQSGQNGWWRLSVTDAAGNIDSGRVYMWGIKFIPLTGIISSNNSIPDNFYLKQNYPNPFNPLTTIEFGLPVDDFVKITIIDILGKTVDEPVSRFLKKGNYSKTWDAKNYSSGIYFIKFTSGKNIFTKKMLLIK